MPGETMACPSCGEPAPPESKWCEACGSDLAATPVAICVSCKRPGIDADGYCTSCGHKQPAPRDHIETMVGRSVAVTDRGLRHHHNEDAVGLAELPDGAVLVVCDGVSSTAGSAEASEAAAAAAVASLLASLTTQSAVFTDAETVSLALHQATVAAQDAAEVTAGLVDPVELAVARQDGPPSSTFVAAVALERPEGLLLSVAWLGDSRAYWLDDAGVVRLTVDHEVNGSLVRWLGADSGRVPPDVTSHTMTTHGRLLLCSDGLWRYADPASELQALIMRLENEGADNDMALAQQLTMHALEGGGHDNISVAIWSRAGMAAAKGSHDERGVDETA